ncbi:hypothetical protein L3556_11390 [Candidatus Synechococcus calcipolaris G9]|uniref:DUF3592 domain-containing protein n=1 Tax=Candidatus Synechococcus calcipolaris G9 TaxID=1497997 RepID=A0ABT6F173_9SYNE|nr:hypothetical protein [Candidatus Synechococcus calcipolaris]MDG2991528.1 hypothetical protein [Candidatus Synechococcus calcipolaris G9]
MNIIEESPKRLIVREWPWIVLIIGGLCTVTGFIPLLFLGHHELLCQRSSVEEASAEEGECQIIKSSLLGTQIHRMPLAAIEEARLNRNARSDTADTYQMELVTHEGHYGFGLQTSDRHWHESLTQRMNRFLAEPSQTQLRQTQNNLWLGLFFILNGVGLGVAILVIGIKILTIEIDQRLGVLKLSWQGCLGKDVKEYRISMIRGAIVESSYLSRGNIYGNSGFGYRVALVMNSGERVPLRWYYSTGWSNKDHLARKIRHFLGLPEESVEI